MRACCSAARGEGGTPASRATRFAVPTGTIATGQGSGSGLPLTASWSVPSPPTTTRRSIDWASIVATCRIASPAAAVKNFETVAPRAESAASTPSTSRGVRPRPAVGFATTWTRMRRTTSARASPSGTRTTRAAGRAPATMRPRALALARSAGRLPAAGHGRQRRMRYHHFGSGRYVLRLDPGEEVVASIQSFAREKKVRAGWVSGLGSLDHAVLGFLDPKEKEYIK